MSSPLNKTATAIYRHTMEAVRASTALEHLARCTGLAAAYSEQLIKKTGVSIKPHVLHDAFKPIFGIHSYGTNAGLSHVHKCAVKKDSSRPLTQGCSEHSPATFIRINATVEPSPFIMHQAIEDKKSEETIFTHSTSNEGVLKILESQSLVDMRGSTGVASQPGICISTDMRASSATDVLGGNLRKPMVFFTLGSPHLSNISLAQSTYTLSDMTTFKSSETELPIEIIMYNDDEGNMTIVDSAKFLKLIVTNLMQNTVTIDAVFLFKAALWLDGCGYELVDNDERRYDINELFELDPLKIGEIVLKTIKEPLNHIEKAEKVAGLMMLQIKGLESRGHALGRAAEIVGGTHLTDTMRKVAELCTSKPADTPSLIP